MVSKFATLLLIIHIFVDLYLTTTLQGFDFNRDKDFLPGQHLLFNASVYCTFGTIAFFLLTFLNYACIPRSWRVSFKRHLLIVLVLAPILAQVIGRGGGAACFDQLDASDVNVLVKGVYCEYRFGLSRSDAERRIGKRRGRMEFVENLARVCNEAMRDMDHWTGYEPVCWMGHGGGLEEEKVGEERNSEREWLRRGFEECHERFGVEALMSWRDDSPFPSVKMKTPRIEGTIFTGDFVDLDDLINKDEAAFLAEAKELI
ncbi:hypothetical protein LSUB1_G005963 [Lachnellula subtilissima]|uniref:Uncharacterized protein n=1 Tax=Lachnellula subtilissima TaxID=602034 RepID=A0A8H8U4I0_9HELO|nr:hypothetical protein LSUB1_G005963 [Lachnellula subtilissima]